MDRKNLIKAITRKKSMLCIGLDTDIKRIPAFIRQNFENPVLEFNKRIIQACKEYAVAFKINTAFYEAQGTDGWRNLIETIDMIPDDIFIIADAKRADIGNTSKLYARAFFEIMNVDAVTVAPYMGYDSLTPFLQYQDKWIIVLALTSNAGSKDFQYLKCRDGKFLFEHILEQASGWGNPGNMMFVAGATHPDEMTTIRRIVPEHFLLVPGVGAQGGDMEQVLQNALTKDYGLLFNSSRGIIYASDKDDFDMAAKAKAKQLRDIMSKYIKNTTA